jgi:hypothetical protein
LNTIIGKRRSPVGGLLAILLAAELVADGWGGHGFTCQVIAEKIAAWLRSEVAG